MLERSEEVLTVLLVLEYGLLLVSTRGHVIDCAGILYAERAGHEKKIAKGTTIVKPQDLTLIWLTVVKEKTVSPPLRTKGMTSVIAPGHNQRRDLSATIDHSDIRGFDRMTCLHRGAVSL